MIKKAETCFDDCLFVILGATGDLAKRKLIPAVYKLIAENKLCHFALVGVSIDDSNVHEMLALAKEFIPSIDRSVWEKLRASSYYFKMDFYDDSAYGALGGLLKQVEQSNALMGNRLFYLATLPQHFVFITQSLAQHGIVEKHKVGKVTDRGTWSRVVYEKPFGRDLKSARKINRAIARVFDEKQAFRIDHYLGKELVGNIALVRFTNRIFEPLWNNKHIHSVQIVLSERLGIEGRGNFYDSYGALKDVVQNHLLQILSLVTMESPEKFVDEDLRDNKVRVLSRVTVESAVLGQYEGYLNERDVKPNSKTDTFAALKLSINNRRWKGVPFYLKAGKFLAKDEISVFIKFKMVKCLLDVCPREANFLMIRIKPDEGFYLGLNVKVPGSFGRVIPVNMNFSHSRLFGPNTPAAYEVLLSDVIRGDHFAFVRADEIERSWKIIKQVEQLGSPLYSYAKGSFGPKELELLDKENEVRWHV